MLWGVIGRWIGPICRSMFEAIKHGSLARVSLAGLLERICNLVAGPTSEIPPLCSSVI